MTNPVCAVCAGGRNCLNGRRCIILNRWVEYASTPPCRDTEEAQHIKP